MNNIVEISGIPLVISSTLTYEPKTASMIASVVGGEFSMKDIVKWLGNAYRDGKISRADIPNPKYGEPSQNKTVKGYALLSCDETTYLQNKLEEDKIMKEHTEQQFPEDTLSKKVFFTLADELTSEVPATEYIDNEKYIVIANSAFPVRNKKEAMEYAESLVLKGSSEVLVCKVEYKAKIAVSWDDV